MRLARALRHAGAALVATALAGCASGHHDSEIVGGRYLRTPIDTWNLTILRIDGLDRVTRPARVEPGRRRITVQGPSAPASPQGQVHDVELNVAPCTRYYLVAVRTNALSPDFTVRVDFEEPVSGCTPLQTAG